MDKPQLLTPIRRVEDYVSPGGQRKQCWEYQCVCGNKIEVVKGQVSSGKTRSCGCLRNPMPDPIPGDVFTRLTVMSKSTLIDGDIHPRCWCRCECGNETSVRVGNLKQGSVKSCGCLVKDRTRETATKLLPPGTVFGHLIVVSGPFGRPHRYTCRCVCGKEKSVSRGSLAAGSVKSCGCLSGKMTGLALQKQLCVGHRCNMLTITSEAVWHNGKRHYPCVCDCGTETLIQAVRLTEAEHGTKSCGCLKIRRAQERKGALHPNWRRDLSPKERLGSRLRHHVNEGVAARTAAFVRDQYACQACGKRGRINAHHLLPWVGYATLQEDPRNLITLCKECHRQLHKRIWEDMDTTTDELKIATEWLKETWYG